MGVLRKKFVVGIFGVWIFGLLQRDQMNYGPRVLSTFLLTPFIGEVGGGCFNFFP